VTDSESAGRSTPAPAGSRTDNDRYLERLFVPWWHWLLPLVAAGLLAAEVPMGFPSVPSWLPYALLVPLMAGALAWLSRVKVGVAGGELLAGDAHLPLRYVGQVEVLTGAEKRVALGRELDPAAFVLHRGWVPAAIRVELTDPEDPTPYWIFSARSPKRIAALLEQGG
jgi:hypothetical protein